MRAPALAVALSWALLGAWLASPYARFLSHGTGASDVPSALGVGALFAAGWALMTLAMMLPSASALLRLFERVVAPRADGSRLVVLLVLGFLAVWTSVGLAFRAFDTQVHAVVDASGWARAHTSVVGVAALVTAGAFQFSSLKLRCLTACRRPRSF